VTAGVVGWIAGAYLIGAIPASYLVARWGAGIDLRQHGSKNLGATNVYRVLGWKYAVPAGVFDVVKGLAPVLLAKSQPEPWLPLAVGAAAVVGHVFSVFVGLKGGKGVATAGGVVLGLAPLALAVSIVVWGGVLKLTGYVSLGSILGALTLPLWVRILYPTQDYTFWVGIALALFIVYTHRVNIRRLMTGTESRFGRGAANGRTA
jgi:glycerol-3-phosphate acyltransferase PlsY